MNPGSIKQWLQKACRVVVTNVSYKQCRSGFSPGVPFYSPGVMLSKFLVALKLFPGYWPLNNVKL